MAKHGGTKVSIDKKLPKQIDNNWCDWDNKKCNIGIVKAMLKASESEIEFKNDKN